MTNILAYGSNLVPSNKKTDNKLYFNDATRSFDFNYLYDSNGHSIQLPNLSKISLCTNISQNITGLSLIELLYGQGISQTISVTGLRGYGELWQDRLELLAAGFLTPLHHLVEERSVGLRHDDCRQRRRSGQLL